MPIMISETKRRNIQDAIRAGITVTEIRTLLSTSAGTISKVKRAMGIPLRDTRPRHTRVQAGPQAAPSQPPVMHHREITHSYLEKVKELEKRGFTPSPEDITSEDEQPAQSSPYSPQEYFEAIADGLRQRDTENAALRYQLAELRAENQTLLSGLTQLKMRMANWSGPTSLPGRTLGNGG
jgi:IS30 family transposase